MITGDWWASTSPFLHFHATDVLGQQDYRRLDANFRQVIEGVRSDPAKAHRIGRPDDKYDALIVGMDSHLAPLFHPFFALSWLEPLANFLGVPFIPYIEGALHSHSSGSRTGWVHSDCCSAWFDANSRPSDGLIFPDPARCVYFTGEKRTSDARPLEFIRFATLIYYLCNDEWQGGDGGETVLYGAQTPQQNTTVRKIAPRNNSLLLFHCTPHSYHRFVTLRQGRRESIILWLHCEPAFAEELWGPSINRSRRS